jgi:hypothetical protein
MNEFSFECVGIYLKKNYVLFADGAAERVLRAQGDVV